ncbi:MAG: DUF177 domain-containing protein [Elusimicrobia bacterium]|jgi:uncharacterized metal-binding protein YceD (DUF177 family)|nr:DUF177 domain-containing protein [Elusimicrobiota bacterium]
MRLRIRDIVREKSIELDESIPASRFTLESPDRPELVRPVQAHMKAEIQEEDAWAWVQVRASLTLSCARCLERYELEVRPSFEVEAPVTEEYLDIDDDIRQNIFLSLPPKPLCRPGCRGLCSMCGKNLNKGPCGCPPPETSSVFDVLKNLKLK